MMKKFLFLFALALCFVSCSNGADEKIMSCTLEQKKLVANLLAVNYCKDVLVFDIEDGDTVAAIYGHTQLIVGIDFREFKDEDFTVNDGVLQINCPAPKVIHFIFNPESREIVWASRKWNYDARIAPLWQKAENIVKKSAFEKGAFDRAKKNAESVLEKMYSTIPSVKSVKITFKGGDYKLNDDLLR